MSILICPVCRRPLTEAGQSLKCDAGHCFDRAREGYCNLLPVRGRRSRNPGDAPALVQARRAFLDAGYYAPLRENIAAELNGGVVLDACCGEGYYTAAFAQHADEMYGFDIAKDAVRLAAGRDKRTRYFVAGLHAIPVRDGRVDTLTHLFAPFAGDEFVRVLKRGGRLLHVLPGKDHLMGLKRVLYDAPYENRETLPQTALTLVTTRRVRYTITLQSGDDIRHLFAMTPYSYKTKPEAASRLLSLDTLETAVDFLIAVYGKE